MKIKYIGEFGLIKRIRKKPKNKDILVGIGDDAAIVKANNLQVLTTDCHVDEVHFSRKWFSPEQIGMKAIEANVSDVAAMGGKPKFVLVSLILPKELSVEFFDRMYKGMWKSCKKHSMEIVGGNITSGKQLSISITILGQVTKPCLRSTAKAGDLIFVSGYLGGSMAGLKLFQKGIKCHEKVKRCYLEPKADIISSERNSFFVNAMIDVSDGLASEIIHICNESRCGAVVHKDNIPVAEEVCKVAYFFGDAPKDYALYGGEDFGLVYTVPEKNLNKVSGFLIGEITKKRGIFLYSNGKKKILKGGYEHFKR